jgi:hypothetical protein
MRLRTRSILGPLALAGLVAAAARPAAAQYFGQNKVQYRAFDFKIIQTEHFEVYYYDEERAAALDAARMAERGYAKLSRVLNHRFQGRKPVILYASHSDFQQTNAIYGDLGEGTGGVTEFFKHRMVLPFTGAYADFEHVLLHEMAHQFQYDVYSRGRIGAGVQTLVTVNPPLWFTEGMAEFLSIGPVDVPTAMWLRDAALEGRLPTIEQMTNDPYTYFPYRFGHALWSYVAEKWGDEIVGEILQVSANTGIEGAFYRATGLTLEALSDEWREAIQEAFLPDVGRFERTRRIATPALTRRKSKGTYHLAPALSPDGREVAYFSEATDFFISLWVADVESGRIKRRLVRSGFSTDFESLRFIYSVAAYSPDGRWLAITAKRKERDDIVILDARTGEETRRIRVPLNGVMNPNWAPDGRRLVFTGFAGGLSDLYIVNTDGSGFDRLTDDRYADLQPAWSPDGNTIAFVTDRGPDTDFNTLEFGNYRVALYRLDARTIEPLDHMEQGRNINPVWSPDGKALAFISDRTGVSNVFLYELAEGEIYQLSNVITGISGITALSPALSWASQADRLAVIYYQDGAYDVYVTDNPRQLKKAPYRGEPGPQFYSLVPPARADSTRPPVGVAAAAAPGAPAPGAVAAPAPGAPPAEPTPSGSVYRSPSGFRASAEPAAADTAAAPGPVSVRSLLDSAEFALPDTLEFAFRRYRTRFSPDYVARPTIGYSYDNWGRGFYGGAAISLSDMLGNKTLIFAGAVNGRPQEAQLQTVYVNQTHRLNWAVGFQQQPYYFYGPYTPPTFGDLPGGGRPDSGYIERISILRYVVRQVFGETAYPLSRYTRTEFGLRLTGIEQDLLAQDNYFDQTGFYLGSSSLQTIQGPSVWFAQPSVALVHDRSLFGYVGPFAGTRYRFQVSPTIGDWRFMAGLGDFRKYLYAKPFTFAVRGLFFGRFGRDADGFPAFLGSTELLRGYTYNSIVTHECAQEVSQLGGCSTLQALTGSKLAVLNGELRFPLFNWVQFGFLPVGLPPVEGAVFYDVGVAWNEGQTVATSRDPGETVLTVRTPLRSWGGSIRVNALGFIILRFDYTKPLDRSYDRAYWTVSIGPTF